MKYLITLDVESWGKDDSEQAMHNCIEYQAKEMVEFLNDAMTVKLISVEKSK